MIGCSASAMTNQILFMFDENAVASTDKKRRTAFRAQNITKFNQIRRMIWNAVWLLLYRPSPVLLHGWRRMLLRLFGARIGYGAHPYPSARIWAPWNLHMDEHSCLSHWVDCYCVDRVTLGKRVTVSQYSFLCTASHDHTRRSMPLVTAPISIDDDAWVTADVFVGPGVTIGAGAMVLARSCVVADVAPWQIVAGNPATPRGTRHLTAE
jgi:putative colanic acid biosynthesis acetyltransferase WcaF